MHFNSDGLAQFAEAVGDHEGRLTHKPPPRTLYDSAYKERWFKLKANLLFYYRLNEFGAVGKNEPSGVFVLENIEVQREDADAPFGFAIAIKWKDDLERKHLFFAPSEASACTWFNKLIHASYEHLREQMIMLRSQISRRTGRDPLQQLGTPLVQRTSRVNAQRQSQFHVNLEEHDYSQELPKKSTSESPVLRVHRSAERRSPSVYSVPTQSPVTRVKVQKSPSLEPMRTAPLPPPRRAKKQDAGNGQVVVSDLVAGVASTTVDDLVPGVGRNKASFQCHIDDDCLPKKRDNLLD